MRAAQRGQYRKKTSFHWSSRAPQSFGIGSAQREQVSDAGAKGLS
jgi:hypothetical protein